MQYLVPSHIIPTMNIANKIHNATGNAITKCNTSSDCPIKGHCHNSMYKFLQCFTMVPTIKAMNTAKIVIKDANKMI